MSDSPVGDVVSLIVGLAVGTLMINMVLSGADEPENATDTSLALIDAMQSLTEAILLVIGSLVGVLIGLSVLATVVENRQTILSIVRELLPNKRKSITTVGTRKLTRSVDFTDESETVRCINCGKDTDSGVRNEYGEYLLLCGIQVKTIAEGRTVECSECSEADEIDRALRSGKHDDWILQEPDESEIEVEE